MEFTQLRLLTNVKLFVIANHLNIISSLFYKESMI